MKYLVTINIPFARSSEGKNFVNALWAKDVLLHAQFVSSLIVASPEQVGGVPADWVEVPAEAAVRFVGIRTGKSVISSFALWGLTAKALAKEIAGADVVQLAVSGWPLPLGWIARRAAKRLGRVVVTVVESAPWRDGRGVRGKMEAWLHERMARRCVGSSDLAVFTHRGYRDTLCTGSGALPTKSTVIPATWIDEDAIVDGDRPFAVQSQRSGAPLRVLFAGRLVASKGTATVVELIGLSSEVGGIAFTIIGEGEDLGRFESLQASAPGRVSVLPPANYGPEFREVIDGHDVVIVPTLSDEQPRIIFDAFARGVPVVASHTVGNAEVVVDGDNGRMFRPGDAAGALGVLIQMRSDRSTVATLGSRAIATARLHTHSAMHRRRVELVEEALASKSRPNPAAS